MIRFDWTNPHPNAVSRLSKLLAKKDALTDRFLKFYVRQYRELDTQRIAIRRRLHDALNKTCVIGPYKFTGWARAIRYKYSDHPLSAYGSLVLGGRFNFGKNLPQTEFEAFPCFYAASDTSTALQEAFGQDTPHGLSALEMALGRKESLVVVQVSGSIDQVLDLRDTTCLKEFVKLTRGFRFSSSLMRMARTLPVAEPTICKSVRQLRDSLLHPLWRQTVYLCETPANGQIFGQIVQQAGIEGILYPSKMTGKDCLALFPGNFEGGTSFITLDGPLPANIVGPARIDRTNFEAALRSSESISSSAFRNPT